MKKLLRQPSSLIWQLRKSAFHTARFQHSQKYFRTQLERESETERHRTKLKVLVLLEFIGFTGSLKDRIAKEVDQEDSKDPKIFITYCF